MQNPLKLNMLRKKMCNSSCKMCNILIQIRKAYFFGFQRVKCPI